MTDIYDQHKAAFAPTELPDWAKARGMNLNEYIAAWEDGHADLSKALCAIDPTSLWSKP